MAKMKTYLVIYHMSPAAARRGEKMRAKNPNAAADGMEGWMIWAKKCGDQLVDLGSPLAKGVKVNREGSTPSRRNVAGYSVLSAPSLAAAKKLMKNHPHIAWDGGCDIEIHESQPLPS
jgi:hypothetical protein